MRPYADIRDAHALVETCVARINSMRAANARVNAHQKSIVIDFAFRHRNLAPDAFTEWFRGNDTGEYALMLNAARKVLEEV